jgi:hypothetical protein
MCIIIFYFKNKKTKSILGGVRIVWLGERGEYRTVIIITDCVFFYETWNIPLKENIYNFSNDYLRTTTGTFRRTQMF